MSGFSVDADGWLISGDANAASVKPDYNGTGGNPDGLISAKDEVTGGVWFFVAPQKYLGVGQEPALRSQGRQDAHQPLRRRRREARGRRRDAGVRTPSNPVGDKWTSYVVPLKASAGWTVGTLSGAAATDADLTTVLGATTALWIRGEFNTGPDTGFLDNVRWGASN